MGGIWYQWGFLILSLGGSIPLPSKSLLYHFLKISECQQYNGSDCDLAQKTPISTFIPTEFSLLLAARK